MAQINEQIRANATFYYDNDISDATPAYVVAPASVTFTVLDSEGSTLVSATALEDGDTYYYTFTPTEEGEYTLRFTATYDDADDLIVEDTILVGPESATPVYLDSEVTITFSPLLSPLYIDPDELAPFFPTLTTLDYAEAIFIPSVKVKDILSLTDDEDPPNYALDYIFAAAACALSREVDDVFGSGAYTKDDFTLGDLTVKDSSGTTSKGDINTGNASTWCELAYALEREMKLKSAGPKAFVKGSYHPNPVPERRLPNKYGLRADIKDTGRIDD